MVLLYNMPWQWVGSPPLKSPHQNVACVLRHKLPRLVDNFLSILVWYWMWSPLHCPLQGTLHRILHNYGWWGYVKWVSGILEQIICESIELFWFRCTWRINPSTQLIENEVFAGMDLCAHLLEWLPHPAFSRFELLRLRSLKYLRFTISVYCIFVNLKPKSPWVVVTPFQAISVVYCHR